MTPWTTLSFDGIGVGSLPPNWSQWSSDPNTSFAVTSSPTATLSGSNSFSVTGDTSQAVTRTWLDTTMPADVQVSAAVYVSSLIPAQVIARGSNLNAPDGANGPSFYALQLSRGSPGPELQLIKDVNGSETSLGTIYSSVYVQNYWLEETLDVEGSTVRAQLFDPKLGEYLNSSGQWQTTQAWAMTVLDTSISGPGFVGLGRPASYAGTVTFDDFSVLTLTAGAADQTFDSTPDGSWPDNWSQWSSNGNNLFAVASPTNPTPFSSPNAMTVTPVQSSDTARAWLNTSLPADLTASAEVYLNALTPAQVFARGSDLDSATPTYYAVEVSRGGTVELVKVIDGVATDLGSITSTAYLQNRWVQETLSLSGSTLEAQVYLPDLGEYLNSSGGLQATQTWAVSTTDTSISGGGQAGLARPVVKEYVETNYFDDFTTSVGGDGGDAQNFDSTPANMLLPSSMKQWSSDSNDNYFAVAAAPDNNHFLSDNYVLESNRINSGTTAQAWDTSQSLTNAQVSMGLYMYSSMPTVQLIARGTDLGSTTTAPSYYGLSITGMGSNGMTINLVRVNGGTQSPPLAQVQEPYYFNQWLQETLYVDGDNLRASIYRADTGQYLDSNGQWQTLPTYAMNTTDTSSQALTGAGYGGIVLATPSSYTGYYDNFAVVPLTVDSTPPTVTVSAPSGTLSGNVTVTATPTEPVPGYSISKVEFYVDGVLNWVDTASPYTWDFDTSSVSNETHTLLVKAYDNEDNIGEVSTTITTSNNTTLTMPNNFTQHQNDIGITELAYDGKDGNPYDSTLLKNNVDVVVTDTPSFLSTLATTAPNDQRLLYTNVSNIYLSELTSWLNYAETNSIDPEDAFYHVSIATPFSAPDDAGSTQPVDWFWSVYGYQNSSWNNFTEQANGIQSTSGVPFGKGASVVGDTMNVGYTDKFAEIDIKLSTAGSGGSYVLEYPSAVDSNGNPTTWSTLTASDGTNGLTTSGTITFDPASNWVPAVVDGSGNNPPRYYYVRFRTTAAFNTIPVATSILGDNYTQTVDNNGIVTGTIPAYDWALNPQGTYLDSQQYATASAAGMTARFGYQSRLFYDGPMRFSTNPSNPSFKVWALQYYPLLLNGQQYATGLFVDNSTANPPWDGSIANYSIEGTNQYYKVDLVESTDSYSNDYATLLNEIGLKIAPDNGWIMANTGGSASLLGSNNDGQTYADPVVSKVQAYYEEFGLAALADDTTGFLSLYSKVYNRVINDNPSYAVIDSKSKNGSEQDGQTQLTTLAAYYLLAPSNSSKGALDFYGGEAPSTYWVQSWSPPPSTFNHWSQAATYNVGAPVSPLPSPQQLEQDYYAKGTESDGSTYYVYGRDFTGQNGQPVLVLYKPISQFANGTDGSIGSATATSVPLSGSYYVLQADGTLSSTAVTSISLENGEGEILVQASGMMMAPMVAKATPATASDPTVPTAAMSVTQSTSGSSPINQGNPGLTSGELLTAEFFERLLPGLFIPNAVAESRASMGLPADPFNLSADLDRHLSLLTVAKMTAPLTESNRPATVWSPESSQAQMASSIPPTDTPLWLVSYLPKIRGNSSLFDESFWPVDDAVG